MDLFCSISKKSTAGLLALKICGERLVGGGGIKQKGKRTHGHGQQCGDCGGQGEQGLRGTNGSEKSRIKKKEK